ncbi:n/a [Ectocarpus siliculosus]|uniref:N/a n=1 Tax=Ectocarpus siliculosus TaxID=2880 RepID=D7FSG9_ECTSI|nr:n/a [Ectocarpus siliculosus]|eukprot:CBJ31110.1 n/a [Ectocarpus siliculosus]
MSGDCPNGMPTPCLANGGLSVTVDGEETADDSPLLHPISPGLTVAAGTMWY